MLAVTMNTVAQVGGGAGVLHGGERCRVSTGEERGLLVGSSCFALMLVPPFASFASPLLPLVTIMQICKRRRRVEGNISVQTWSWFFIIVSSGSWKMPKGVVLENVFIKPKTKNQCLNEEWHRPVLFLLLLLHLSLE